MRPVQRPPSTLTFSEHREAYRPLVAAIGRYCSYCEAPLKNGHVEHVLPQQHYGSLRLLWSNFLLACSNCNGTKQAWPNPGGGGRKAGFWPDCDNTSRAFQYAIHQPPQPEGSLTVAQRRQAQEMLRRTGLDKSPAHPDWSASDDRWDMRNDTWDIAAQCKVDLQAEDTEAHRRSIAGRAGDRGFWSVWRTVFADDEDMLRRINSSFKGTSRASFHLRTAAALPRPGGRL